MNLFYILSLCFLVVCVLLLSAAAIVLYRMNKTKDKIITYFVQKQIEKQTADHATEPEPSNS